MSAFYTLNYGDRIELLTDGAVYEDDGTLTAVRRKVWHSERIPMAVTGRGNASAVQLLAMAVLLPDAYGSTDRVLEAVPGLLDKMAAKQHGGAKPGYFEIVIAAISETRGPVIFYASSADCYGAGYVPFTLVEAGSEFGGGVPIDPAGIDVSDGLRTCGAEIFERMRRVRGPNPTAPELPPLYGIGGHVDLTVVRPGGVTVERLRTWPDVIGEPIDPFRELAEAA